MPACRRHPEIRARRPIEGAPRVRANGAVNQIETMHQANLAG